MEVTKNGAAVSPSWLTLTQDTTNIPQTTSPSLTVNTNDVNQVGFYIVTVKSQLYAEAAIKSFTFKLFMTPCQIQP